MFRCRGLKDKAISIILHHDIFSGLSQHYLFFYCNHIISNNQNVHHYRQFIILKINAKQNVKILPIIFSTNSFVAVLCVNKVIIGSLARFTNSINQPPCLCIDPPSCMSLEGKRERPNAPQLKICKWKESLAAVYYGRYEHATEGTPSPLLQRASNGKDPPLDQVHSTVLLVVRSCVCEALPDYALEECDAMHRHTPVQSQTSSCPMFLLW